MSWAAASYATSRRAPARGRRRTGGIHTAKPGWHRPPLGL